MESCVNRSGGEKKSKSKAVKNYAAFFTWFTLTPSKHVCYVGDNYIKMTCEPKKLVTLFLYVVRFLAMFVKLQSKHSFLFLQLLDGMLLGKFLYNHLLLLILKFFSVIFFTKQLFFLFENHTNRVQIHCFTLFKSIALHF